MNKFIVLLIFFAAFITECFAEANLKICSSTECYTIIEKLGEGFFGNVYSVENSKGEKFALKSYKHHDENPQTNLLGDMEREFQRGQTLNHENIIRSIDLFTFSNASNEMTNNLILQLVEGSTLFETPRGTLSPEQALNAAKQFSDALRYALSNDLLHLDLHTGNVMVSNQGDIMVIDLASFFSFDEIFGYVASQSLKNSQQSEKNESQKRISHAMQIQATNSNAGVNDPIKEEKLRHFFIRNPKLMDQLKQTKYVHHMDIAKNRAPYSYTYSSSEANVNGPNRNPIYYYYFDNITAVCIKIMATSTLNREEKINKQLAIKKLAWNYAEDIEEGKVASFEDYLERLLELFES